MRIWSLAPEYLDARGLVALWREALLARKVLSGETQGYKNHPQLERFRKSPDPLLLINAYLGFIYQEAGLRKYNFAEEKFIKVVKYEPINVAKGQIEFELQHLRKKLQQRAPEMLNILPLSSDSAQVVPIFHVVAGNVESWEKGLTN